MFHKAVCAPPDRKVLYLLLNVDKVATILLNGVIKFRCHGRSLKDIFAVLTELTLGTCSISKLLIT